MTPSVTEERPNNTLDQMITSTGSIGCVYCYIYSSGGTVADGSATQHGDAKKLYVQLLGAMDPSIEEDKSSTGRWREYVATYVTEHPTEWTPARRVKSRPLFLRRYVITLHSIPDGYACANLRLFDYVLFIGA